MRILAIRGCNLASLSGDFEVLLDQGALEDTGLYAITGPTGAGKSSLLDALCLALFNRTPRLEERGGPAIGHVDDADRLAANDARQLLRRGAVSGYAEVDFEGADASCYRARWSVRRARNRITGKVQKPELSLKALPSEQPVAGGLRETQVAVERCLGLSYAQFTKSVLLAQGEFAAFLKAGDDDRARLLERITGTEIYGELSVAAHRRAADEEALLAACDSRLGATAPLAPDSRAELDEQRAQAEARLRRADTAHRDVDAKQRWHQDMAVAEQALARAIAEAREASDALQAAAGLRAELERMAVLQPLLSTYRQHAEKQAQIQQAETELEVAEHALDEARSDAEQTRQQESQAQLAKQQALDQAEAVRPQRERALTLDHDIARLNDEHAKAEVALAEARVQHDKQAAIGTSARAELDQKQRSLAELMKRSEELAVWAGYAEQAGLWQDRLQRFDEVSREQAQLAQQADQLDVDGKVFADAVTTSSAALSQVQSAHDEAERAFAELDQRRQATDETALASRQDAHARLQRSLQSLQQAVSEHLGAEASAARSQQAVAGAEQRIAQLNQLIADIAAERPLLEVRLDEARRASAVESEPALALRAELHDGEPCPVCGASDHPWASRPGQSAEASRLTARVAELEQQLSEQRAEHASLSGQLNEAEQGRLRLADEHARAVQALEQAAMKRAQQWRSCGLSGEYSASALNDEQQRLATLGKDLTDETESLQQLKTRWDSAHKQRDRSREALRSQEKAHAEQLRRQAEHLSAVDKLNAGGEGLAKRYRQLSAELQPLVDLGTPLPLVPALLDECQNIHAQLAAAATALERAEHASHAAEQQLTSAQQRRHEAEHSAGQIVSMREQVMAERDGLLDGLPINDWDARQQRQLKALADELLNMQSRSKQAAAELSQSEARLGERQAALAGYREAGQALSRRVAELSRELVCDQQELDAIDARPQDWADHSRARLHQLEQANSRQQGAVAQAGLRVDELRPQAPQESVDEVAALLSETSAELERARGHQAELVAQVKADDRRRAEATELIAERDQQAERTALWLQMKELIGHNRGATFRNYAQSLNLERLLIEANAHLARLNPRYQLQRVPGEDLALQVVDRDMADEVRATQSLSGGEGFLVSLALALGLSGMTVSHTVIGSLFIDEGFGTLDTDTLDAALATLDTVQSEGRQIGVISHVAALTERIGAAVVVEPSGSGASRVRVTRMAG